MNTAEIVLALLTLAAIGLWVLYVKRLRGHRTARTGVIILTLLLIDGWLWDVASASHFGRQHGSSGRSRS